MKNFSEKKKTFVYIAITFLAKIILPLVFRIEVNGIKNLPQRGGFILLPKHQRWEDVPLLSVAIPRLLYFIAKYELFSNSVSRYVLSSLGGIPLNRETPLKSREELIRMLELLSNGQGIVIFPEGTYFRDEMGRGKMGLIKMILSRRMVRFIPVGISYKRNGFPTNVRINIGRSIYGDASSDPEPFFRNIMNEIKQLSGLS